MPRSILPFLIHHRIFVAFALVGAVLLAWQRRGMDTELVLDPSNPGIRMYAIDDHPYGGNSVCSAHLEEGRWHLDYDIRPGVSWAFCGMHLDIGDSTTGIGRNFSDYDTMVVRLDRMTGQNDQLQVQLLAKFQNAYRPEDPSTIKFMAMNLIPRSDSRRNALPLSVFAVPSWWTSRFHIPAEQQAVDQHDVRALEILTSNGRIAFDKGQVEIGRIELHGKWIRQPLLLLVLLLVGGLYPLGYVSLRLYKTSRAERSLRQQARKLQELAGMDPLTEILNRRGFEEAFSALRSGSSIDGDASLGIMMVDLDHFKRINDTFGHDGGDAILRQAARILSSKLRPGNLCCRYGGEEFLVALPGISLPRLRILAEQTRSELETAIGRDEMKITASFGIAIGTASELEHLIKRADEALYRAKANGRNRVEEAG